MVLSETAEKYKAQKAQARKQARESARRQRVIRLSKVRPEGLFLTSDRKDWMFPSNYRDKANSLGPDEMFTQNEMTWRGLLK
jgi:hypothetical protein